MGFSVTAPQFAAPFDVEMGETILDAALRAGLAYPHGCRSGNCGACKSALIEGEVEMSPHSEFALSPAERANGLILACRAVPWSDCSVRILDADETVAHPLRKMQCRVVDVADLTHDIRRVRLAIEEGGPFTFTAGQYANIRFADLPSRDYSMANRPDQPLLEFHIRLVPGGAVTPFVREQVKAGDSVRVEGPFGTSYLRDKHTGPILALAGGSGLAPIKSIVETALAGGKRQPITLYFGVRAERDLYGEAEFQALMATYGNFRFVAVLSSPDGPTVRRTGFLADAVRADLLAAGPTALDGAKAYLAGPPVMVESAVAALADLGVGRQDCHADAFYTEADKAKIAAASAG
ncbi:MAG: 2Fe-2S iron-sulfur cluster binding domain-containing protein [Alphaproteobacteria bacterium]|nr:2Fe-2S iron-sulfur cluster binding domain-containing protein [Alphaproteobacteria bacterium]